MKAWAIRHWDIEQRHGGLYIDTVRRTRAAAIEAFKEQYDFDDEKWAHDRRWNIHKAVRVVVTQ